MMNFKNFGPGLKKISEMLRDRVDPVMDLGEKYVKLLIGYLQTSETIFLLLFANIIGVRAALVQSYSGG